jgi:hypothetical protein
VTLVAEQLEASIFTEPVIVKPALTSLSSNPGDQQNVSSLATLLLGVIYILSRSRRSRHISLQIGVSPDKPARSARLGSAPTPRLNR